LSQALARRNEGSIQETKAVSIVGDVMAEIRLGRAEVEHGRLPKVCMVCGRRASVKRKKAFRWSPLWIMLVGGAILARIMSKKMTIHAPFCKGHRNHWLMRTLLIVFGFLGVVAVSFALITIVAVKSAERGPEDKPLLIAVGFAGALFFAWLIMLIVLQLSAIRAKEITDKSMTLTGVNQSFIAALRDLREERRNGADERKVVVRRRPQPEEEDDADEDEDDEDD
jgi:hypothetical protein